jgi:hypothetical protein
MVLLPPYVTVFIPSSEPLFKQHTATQFPKLRPKQNNGREDHKYIPCASLRTFACRNIENCRTGVLAPSADRDDCALHAGQTLSQTGVHRTHYIWGCFASNLLSIIEPQSLGLPVRNAANFPKAISAPSKEERYCKLEVSGSLDASKSCQHGRCVNLSLRRCLLSRRFESLSNKQEACLSVSFLSATSQHFPLTPPVGSICILRK